MKRMFFLLISSFVVFAGTIPVNFSLWYPMSFNRDVDDEVYFNLGLLYSHFGTLNGLSVNGGYAILEQDINGLSVSGIGQRINGNAKGVLVSPFTLVEGNTAGLDVSAFSISVEEFDGIKVTAFGLNGENFDGIAVAGVNMTVKNLRGIQLGAANFTGGDIYGIQAGGVNVQEDGMKGIETSGMSIIGESFTGVAASGLILAGENMKGAVAACGLITGGDFKGVSASGLSLCGGDRTGVSASGANIVGGFIKGVHGTAVNMAGDGGKGVLGAAANIVRGDFKGVMGGAVNMTAGDFRGVQGGAVNITGGTARGLTLGTVAVAQNQKGVPMAPVMLSRNGEIGVDYTYNNLCPLNFGAKFMSNEWYAISSIGYGDTEDDVSDALVISSFWGRQIKISDVRLAFDLGNVRVFNEKQLEADGIYDKNYFMLRARAGYRLSFAEIYGIVGYGGRMDKDDSDEGEEYADGWSDPEGQLYVGGGLSIHLFRAGQ